MYIRISKLDNINKNFYVNVNKKIRKTTWEKNQ